MPVSDRRALLVFLAIVLGSAPGCGGEPEPSSNQESELEPGGPTSARAQIERTPLVSTGADAGPLSFHQSAGESRPAIELAAGVPLKLRTRTKGTIRYAVAAAEDPSEVVAISLEIAGEPADQVAIEAKGADGWIAHRTSQSYPKGVTAEFTSNRDTWLAGPVTETPRKGAPKPLVVVVVIDTIRADHTSLGGYPISTTPALEHLADLGVAFTRAYSTTSWTRPATASLLTGLEPEQHRAVCRFDLLPEEVTTFAELAGGEGYHTVAFSTNPNVLPIWGFGQGFDRFIDAESRGWTRRKGRDAAWVFEQAIEVVDREEIPLFLYLHVLDPHHPYTPPALSTRSIYPDFEKSEPGKILPGRHDVPPIASAIRRYDGEIRHTDDALGNFLTALADRNQLDTAIIVVVGDHGEEFGDHGSYYHGRTLYEEQLRVPMVIKLPGLGGEGNRVDGLASISDVLPTVVSELSWRPDSSFDGRPLGPLVRDGVPVHEYLTASLAVDEFRAHALIREGEKIVQRLAPDPSVVIYDLAADPGEQNPIADDERRALLRAELERSLAGRREGWHLLICGGKTPQRVKFVVEDTEGPPRGLSLEDEDRARLVNATAEIDIAVGPVTRVRESMGKRISVDMRDEDEIVLSSKHPTLRLESPHDAELIVGQVQSPWPEAQSLDPAAALRAASDRPRCDPEMSRVAVHVWFVEGPGAAATAEPDEALRDRLRALGYLECGVLRGLAARIRERLLRRARSQRYRRFRWVPVSLGRDRPRAFHPCPVRWEARAM